MSQVHEILKKFDEFETSMKMHLAKVDPILIVDLLLRQKKEPNNKNPIYTLEVFIKPNQNTDEIRNRIIKETGMVPAFYDAGTHIVVAHKINFDMLKMTQIQIRTCQILLISLCRHPPPYHLLLPQVLLDLRM